MAARPNRRGRGRPRIKLPIQTIASFYREGATVDELAASWGVSATSILKVLHEADVVDRRRRSRPDLSLPDGGVGLSPQTMAYHRRMSERGR
jgi:uncharacterized protein (DUF433 family)